MVEVISSYNLESIRDSRQHICLVAESTASTRKPGACRAWHTRSSQSQTSRKQTGKSGQSYLFRKSEKKTGSMRPYPPPKAPKLPPSCHVEYCCCAGQQRVPQEEHNGSSPHILLLLHLHGDSTLPQKERNLPHTQSTRAATIAPARPLCLYVVTVTDTREKGRKRRNT